MNLLDFVIAPAYAAAPAPAAPSMLSTLMFPIILIAIMYFLMIRPQMKRTKEHRAMLEKLAVGDEVITVSPADLRVGDVITFAPPAAGDGPEPEAPAAYGDGLQAVHDSSGLSWEEIAARVQANFEATGHWCF